MRLVCWNLEAGFGFDSGKHAAAWEWLEEQNVAAALPQEVVVPERTGPQLAIRTEGFS